MKRKKQVHLTADVVADEQLLVEAIEALLIDHPNMVRHRRRIIRRQEELRRLASGRGWQAYLKLQRRPECDPPRGAFVIHGAA